MMMVVVMMMMMMMMTTTMTTTTTMMMTTTMMRKNKNKHCTCNVMVAACRDGELQLCDTVSLKVAAGRGCMAAC